ncbi:MAG: hypothetical protein ACP6IY_18935 [Promethearchaeia archaeon]
MNMDSIMWICGTGLFFALAFYVQNINSTLLGINLTAADNSIVELIRMCFIGLGIWCLGKSIVE